MEEEQFVWWKHGVFYQIYPRSFQDSDGDGVGDLEGIQQRLDYLVELGVNALWISPIFPSPMKDFGYDVSDYCDIDPLFGDLAAFDRLLTAAHKRGLKVVLDYVPNHTADQHAWFIESRASRDNAKADWYMWHDGRPNGTKQPDVPNNWESFFGGSAWEWDESRQQYYLHLYLTEQPDLNWENLEVREAMHDVLRFWLDRGVDGFRMDVVTHLHKHQAFPDNPVPDTVESGEVPQVEIGFYHKYDLDQPPVHDRIREFRQLFDSYDGDRVTIGETWFQDPTKLSAYYGENLDGLHVPFNFILLSTPWDAAKMHQTLTGYYAAIPEGGMPNFVLGNHDVSRLATRFGYENHRSAGLLLLTLWGIPTMYYGDELGMMDGYVPPEQYHDPLAKLGMAAWGVGRDPVRTPMQWEESANAGFASDDVETWLPVADHAPTLNVETQLAQPKSTLSFYRQLLKLRREKKALHFGRINLLSNLPPNILAFERFYQNERFITLINFESEPVPVAAGRLNSAEIILSTKADHTNQPIKNELTLRPNEGVLLSIT